MKKLTKVFVLMDDDATSCPKCSGEQIGIEVPIEKIPKRVVLHSLGGYDLKTLQCISCGQKAILNYGE